MDTVTISKKEYKKLVSQAKAYQKLAKGFFENVIKDPIDDVVLDFKKTGKYSNGFLEDLENGLRKSTYVKSKA
ncbi:MAG TPA: hypothetical protein PKA39_11375 [Ignavibacteria bacterium]|nr:hypothetical protein [Ignavibacteria bacterium]